MLVSLSGGAFKQQGVMAVTDPDRPGTGSQLDSIVRIRFTDHTSTFATVMLHGINVCME